MAQKPVEHGENTVPPAANPPTPLLGTPPTPIPGGYPARLTVDYPDRPLNRLTTFFRIFVAVPILIILGLLSGPSYREQPENSRLAYETARSALIFLPVVLLILFRQKYPRWWYDWNMGFTRFYSRVAAYLALLRDEYPSVDEEQFVHIEVDYPDVRLLNRWLPLVKWFLAIPHFLVLVFLSLAAVIIVIIAWFAILFTGRYPRGMFDFVVGVMRWGLRVQAYAFLLTTDRYPPFSLD
jgi:hypothetical protein